MTRPIAVLGGTGPEGFGLALRWVQAGETVIIGSRDAKRAQDAANKIKAKVGTHAQVSGDDWPPASVAEPAARLASGKAPPLRKRLNSFPRVSRSLPRSRMFPPNC